MNNNEPIILGKVKKGGKSKPIVIIIVFLFIGAIVLFLPTIKNYFGEENVIDLITSGEIINFIINHDAYVNKSISETKPIENNTKTYYINEKTIIENDKFTLSDFKLTTESIDFKVTVKETINFDENNYYLILRKDNIDISSIKIVGNIKDTDTIKYTFKNNLNSIIQIEGIIKEYKDTDYPKFLLSSDESGLASLICDLDNNKYEYIFDNNKLIRIKQTLIYKDNNNDEYVKKYENYKKINDEINNNNTENVSSTIIENYSGFVFNTDIDISKYTNKIDNNYYLFNTNSNKIKYDMEAKGFDCK